MRTGHNMLSDSQGTMRSGPAAAEASHAALKVTRPAPRDAWVEVWEKSPEGMIFHRPEWLDACCATDGAEDASRLYETPDGRRIIFPMVQCHGGPLRRGAWSMPVGWGLGGAFGPCPIRPDDVSLILADLLRENPRLVVSPGPVSVEAWATARSPMRVRHHAHVVDVRDGFEALWSDVFSSDTRNKVRKARRRGVEVLWGPGTELIDAYWSVFLRWVRQQADQRGLPVTASLALARRREPLARYQAVARHLAERCQVAVALVDGEPAAAVIALLGGPHAHYWRACSDQALVRSRYANHLLLAQVLERAAETGSQYVHLGESGGKRSLMQFKEHFGGRPVSYHELRFGPAMLTASLRVRDLVITGAEQLAARSAGAIASSRARLGGGSQRRAAPNRMT
jgi:Acetyltransferase (GNAT) domain